MSFIHPPRSNLGNRFSQPAKETLISWINEKNNRGFYADQFTFRDPISTDDNGMVEIPFTYDPTGEESTLLIQRVNIGLVPGFQRLVAYPQEFTTHEVLLFLYNDYGLYLDHEMIDIEFDNEVSCRIVIKDNHLVYEGELNITFASSVIFNTDTIARTLDLRAFYAQSDEDKPYIETFQPGGLWVVNNKLWPDRATRRELESKLYHLDNDSPIDYPLLADILSTITGSFWTASTEAGPFNVMNSSVAYNGLANDQPAVAPITYSHLLIVELSDLCENLQGRIHIAYHYTTPSHPAVFPGGYNFS